LAAHIHDKWAKTFVQTVSETDSEKKVKEAVTKAARVLDQKYRAQPPTQPTTEEAIAHNRPVSACTPYTRLDGTLFAPLRM
jgi:hypothetical protein